MQDKVYDPFFRYQAVLFLKRAKTDVFREEIPLQAVFAHSKEPVAWSRRRELEYKPITEGEGWGDKWDSAWFELSGTVPKHWAGKTVALRLNLDGETLMFDEKGTPFYGFTSGSIFAPDYRKEIYIFKKTPKPGQKLKFTVEAAANMTLGVALESDPELDTSADHYGSFRPMAKTMRLVLYDLEVEKLLREAELLFNLSEQYGFPDHRCTRIIQKLHECAMCYQDNPDNAAAARAIIRPLLEQPACASALTAYATGHAHIDVGWLWPVRESIRKAGRTFANQIDLMERFPDYVFGASQPQLYAFVKENYPGLYEKIRKYVAEGRWELQGGMWVEADANLISGESMVRQFVHGKNFFRDEFGQDVRNLWLPDVFGYSAAMPQIIRKAGCDYFVTQKISWSLFNKFPHSTFYWKGIDGTRVLCHFPPENTYNSVLAPEAMRAAENNLQESEFQDEFMVLYGIGDGGGGPCREMVELGNLQKNLEGCPKIKFSRADELMQTLDRKYGSRYQEWSGELYLEAHRATLTTHGRTKWLNRKLEESLAATEFLCSCLPMAQYPADKLDYTWKKLLINQFHDILPGSAIKLVYDVSEKELEDGLEACAGMRAAAVIGNGPQDDDALTVVNSLPADMTAAIQLPEGWASAEVLDENGKPVRRQRSQDGSVTMFPVLAKSSVAVFRKGKRKAAAGEKADDGLILENSLVRYVFSEDGEVISAWDKTEAREILAAPGNHFMMFHDRPNNWEAWDIEFFYREAFLASAKAAGPHRRLSGACRQTLDFSLSIGKSAIHQRAVLRADSKLLEFQTEIDWREERKLLRVLFPTTVSAPRETFSIQYGWLERSTAKNTSWDFAKFEVCGQQYADLSEPEYGVALLNDCKYGYRPDSSVLDLSVLRSPKYPDWGADQNQIHKLTYALYPHQGDFRHSDVIETAQALNRPPQVFAGVALKAVPPCSLDSDSLQLAVIKKAEKSDDVIVRIVETRGTAGKGTLLLNGRYSVCETDLLEWHDKPVEKAKETKRKQREMQLELRPFEILTLRLRKI